MKIWINFLMTLSLACMFAGLLQLWAVAAFGAIIYFCTWVLIFIHREKRTDFVSALPFDRSNEEA